jgi:hypothetical protein
MSHRWVVTPKQAKGLWVLAGLGQPRIRETRLSGIAGMGLTETWVMGVGLEACWENSG